ncbi:MAG: recombinase family protein [Clostridia bacterium]|nr:recombinase family protein [Clostridia bacterium]
MKKGRKSKYEIQENNNDLEWKAALYLRLSVEDENKEISNSILNQKEIIDAFLKKNIDIKIYNTYIDDGYSGTDFERPAFKKLFRDMQNSEFNTIIVKDLSRLGRNYIEAGNFIEQIFPLFNIRFISVNDNIDSFLNPTSINNINISLKNLVNEEYCKDISKKVKSAFETLRKNGKFVSGYAPYGYCKDKNDIHHLVIDEETAKVVKLIFNLCLSGLGGIKIAEELNRRKIVNPSTYRKIKTKKINEISKLDSCWTASIVNKILQNPVYYGVLIQGKTKMKSYKIHKQERIPEEEWTITKNAHDIIIDKETFDKVQQIRSKRKFNWNRSKTKSTIFAGNLKCAECGKNMTKIITSQKNVNGKKIIKYAYVCSTYARRSKDLCSKHYIDEEKLRIAISRSIKYQIELFNNFEKVQQNFNQDDVFYINSLNNNIKKLEYEMEKLQREKKILYEDWKFNKIDEKQFYDTTKVLVDKKYEIEKRIKIEKDKIEKETETRQKIQRNEWADKIGEYKSSNILTKKEIDALINEIYVYEKQKIKINFKYRDEYKIAMDYLKKVAEEGIYNA